MYRFFEEFENCPRCFVVPLHAWSIARRRTTLIMPDSGEPLIVSTTALEHCAIDRTTSWKRGLPIFFFSTSSRVRVNKKKNMSSSPPDRAVVQFVVHILIFQQLVTAVTRLFFFPKEIPEGRISVLFVVSTKQLKSTLNMRVASSD